MNFFFTLVMVVLLAGCEHFKTRDQISKPEGSHTQPGAPSAQPAPEPPADVVVEAPVQTGQAPKIGLILGPGGARAYAHIGFLQELFKNKIPVHAIVGMETSALPAALFANRGQAYDVEWQMMKMKDDLWVSRSLMGGAKSQEVTILDDFLKTAFQGARAEQGQVAFACPVINLGRGNSTMYTRGSYQDLLHACMANPPQFTPFQRNVATLTDLKGSVDFLVNKGANYIVYVHVLGGPMQDSEAEWAQVAQALLRQVPSVNQMVPISVSEFRFNDFTKRREMIRKGQSAGQAAAKSLTERLGL